MRRANLHVVLLATLVLPALATAPARGQFPLTDPVYNAHHPRLLFTRPEIQSFRSKVNDGGRDDAAYAFIRTWVQTVYPNVPLGSVMGEWFGLHSVPGIGIVAHFEQPDDAAAKALGKALTTYIADNYVADFNEANSGMRLRALALGYDMFFETATENERAYIRDEIVSYIQKMVWNDAYRVFEMRPYLGNHSAMFGAALGLAAIALQDEADALLLTQAMDMADRIVSNLAAYQFDPGGAYNEGALYGLWTMTNLIYYFDARKRFDGTDFSTIGPFRKVEEWLAYELMPEGGARSHNLNDSGYDSLPFARNPTYFSWATHEWGSHLSAWLWEHAAGTFGVDMTVQAEKVGTVLWHHDLSPAQPHALLARNRIWPTRGLYCFRTGWPGGASSTDVVFTFYSGKFQGGHAQEDQNQFSLTAYGEKFAIDHGAGTIAKESEAHNLVLVDGMGQHNAGSSIGTDGHIGEYVMGSLADFLEGDATAAYATYSEFNAPNQPLAGTNWSWGYAGANPVLFALRRVLAVHGAGAPPYFVVMDDIDKDGGTHAYEWRMHTLSTYTINTSSSPVVITAPSARMELHLLNPDPASVSYATQSFNNGNADPDATVLRVTRTAVNPAFSFLMIPLVSAAPATAVANQVYPWGYATDITWPGGVVDRVVRNDSGEPVTHGGIATDALVTLVRTVNGNVSGYLASGVSTLAIGGTDYVTIMDGPATCEVSAARVNLDRPDADFRVRDIGIVEVRAHDEVVPFVVRDGYAVPAGTTSVDPPVAEQTLDVSAHPNPFNPVTAIRVRGLVGTHTRIEVFDVAGRRVRALWDGPLPADEMTLAWSGRNDTGEAVASGTYFVRVSTPAGSRALKLTLLK